MSEKDDRPDLPAGDKEDQSAPAAADNIGQPPSSQSNDNDEADTAASPATALHTGKWTPEEEAYVQGLIEEFQLGFLNIPDGTSLRQFLAQMLNCRPKRISKKFEGTPYSHGRKFYQRTPNQPSDGQMALRRSRLTKLERRFKRSVRALSMPYAVEGDNASVSDDDDDDDGVPEPPPLAGIGNSAAAMPGRHHHHHHLAGMTGDSLAALGLSSTGQQPQQHQRAHSAGLFGQIPPHLAGSSLAVDQWIRLQLSGGNPSSFAGVNPLQLQHHLQQQRQQQQQQQQQQEVDLPPNVLLQRLLLQQQQQQEQLQHAGGAHDTTIRAALHQSGAVDRNTIAALIANSGAGGGTGLGPIQEHLLGLSAQTAFASAGTSRGGAGDDNMFGAGSGSSAMFTGAGSNVAAAAWAARNNVNINNSSTSTIPDLSNVGGGAHSRAGSLAHLLQSQQELSRTAAALGRVPPGAGEEAKTTDSAAFPSRQRGGGSSRSSPTLQPFRAGALDMPPHIDHSAARYLMDSMTATGTTGLAHPGLASSEGASAPSLLVDRLMNERRRLQALQNLLVSGGAGSGVGSPQEISLLQRAWLQQQQQVAAATALAHAPIRRHEDIVEETQEDGKHSEAKRARRDDV